MSGWFLEKLEIEGFRGINNEADPLVLKFETDKVNSVFARNGVGKSSIFDALSYVLRGTVPKLSDLEARENGGGYYLNMFHPGGVGTISLTVAPVAGGGSVTVTVKRDSNGVRTVSGPAGVDAEGLLRELNREFVLLDHDTLRTFLTLTSTKRGQWFSGLLGMARYTEVRGELKELTNAKAFNNHFQVASFEAQKTLNATTYTKEATSTVNEFKALTGVDMDGSLPEADVKAQALNALAAFPVLEAVCDGKTFDTVSFDDCQAAITKEDGGTDRDELAAQMQREAALVDLLADGLSDESFEALKALAVARDMAMAATSGDLLYELYAANEKVLKSGTWEDDTKCAACEGDTGTSQTAHMDTKLGYYAEVKSLATQISAEWTAKGWAKLRDVEAQAALQDEVRHAATFMASIDTKSLTEQNVSDLWAWRTTLRQRLTDRLTAVRDAQAVIRARLPASLLDVTTKVEIARRLRTHWEAAKKAHSAKEGFVAQLAKINRVKTFLTTASEWFAAAESRASKRRLQAIEPTFKHMFQKIMVSPVVPKLDKRDGTEELSLSLTDFWGLAPPKGLSALALLSESFRNALSVSVYLAAASLYGGAPKFIVLDDITSSFDAGHQWHMMELIRTEFARPMKADGLQVILLSHDGLLEKLFNKNVRSGGWNHQKLYGTAQTEILTQTVSANQIRDKAVAHLNAGREDDAEPYIRQLLEFTLLQVIDKVRIPVPLAFAINDTRKMVDDALAAIEHAVDLHKAANRLVLDAAQQTSLNANVAALAGNYLSHWATASTSSLSASALHGVIASIDAYARCFQFEDPAGSGQWKYYKSLSQRS
jgi:hypothetical protein